MENSMCTAFKDYKEVPETVPLDFSEDDVMWVAFKLAGAAGALGSEAIELSNLILHFGCALEEFRVVVADLVDWMAKSSPARATYRALIVCSLVAVDKHPGLHPVGIGEMLRQAIAKLIMSLVGGQANTACRSLQLCVGLESGIDRATHAVEQSRQ